FDRIERPIITEYAQQLAQFRAGKIHTSVVVPEDAISTKRDLPGTRLRLPEAFTTNPNPYIRFGYEGDSPFKDVRLRQAVSLSLDRSTFLSAMDNLDDFRREGLDLPSAYNTVIAPGWVGYWLDPLVEKTFGPSAKYLKYDKAEAKK